MSWFCRSNSHFFTIISRLNDLNVWYKHINNCVDRKQLEKASLKFFSDMITRFFDHDSLYFLKALITDSMAILVLSTKISKTTISLYPSPSTTSSKYTGILKLINLYVASNKKMSRIFSNISFIVDLDKIVLWSYLHCLLVPRFETDEKGGGVMEGFERSWWSPISPNGGRVQIVVSFYDNVIIERHL